VPAAPGTLYSVVTALYRRYRPETFAELIGQSQVTDPLRTALRTDRVNHAYLFSGPRGCGKTTSARILARCLNCAEGPTDTPCGVCPSCVELARDGSGSLDVVEIDAASHNGVDDARDLRERAVFAPARDRYKIFILDEAHMVTPQGFNALLKIVEEPPEHVKFIFATTEPEKVIGTIRSRTHHYPFRLVPPAQMLEYTQTLCDAEGISVAPGVLPLVVRAGGGSVRDTLSLLDQLMAGSEGTNIEYERAVALLGYTHGALLDEVIDAIGARDAAAAFTGVDRVIQTGQDPRRFVEDLLERLRDLIIVAATSDGAAAVLRGIPQDELDRMGQQAHKFGTAELSRAADVVNAALTEMTGATSPRLHLELMIARVLVPSSDETDRGALARVERLERRIGVDGAVPVAAPTPAAEPARPSAAEPVPTKEAASPSTGSAAAPGRISPVEAPPTRNSPVGVTPGTVTLQQVRDSWPEVLESVQKAKRSAWMVVFTAKPLELRENGVLVISFPSQKDVDALKQPSSPGEGVGDHLKQAISDLLGFRPALIARVEPTLASPAPVAEPVEAPGRAAKPAPSTLRDDRPSTGSGTAGDTVTDVPPDDDAPEPIEPDLEPDVEPPAEQVAPPEQPAAPERASAVDANGWAVAQIPVSESDSAPASARSARAEAAAAARAKAAEPDTSSVKQRYGESVVREILGASFIEEQTIAPRVTPRIDG
jgi:DNA polymerase-3 subunit gamma/tau